MLTSQELHIRFLEAIRELTAAVKGAIEDQELILDRIEQLDQAMQSRPVSR